MNPISVFVDAAVGILKAINAVLSIVPALAWALALLAVFLWGGAMHHERDAAVRERNVIQASFDQLTEKVVRRNAEAAALLKKLKAERDEAQTRVNEAHNAQEKKDANNLATVDRLSRQLASVRLRDPYARARGCGPGAQGHDAPAAGDRAADAADAPGVLSERTSADIRRLVRRADDINNAYESARADALTCRQAHSDVP